MATELIPTGIYKDPGLLRETDKAVEVCTSRRSGGAFYGSYVAGQRWLPKSKIEWRADVYGEQLFVPAWLARKL